MLSPPTSILSRDKGGQKLSASSGPVRGGHGEPDASFVPRSTKKPHGTCPLGRGLPPACTSPPRGAVARASCWLSAAPWPLGHRRTYSLEEVATAHWEGQRAPSALPCPGLGGSALPLAGSPRPRLSAVPPARPAGHDSDSDSELSLDEQSSSYASSHSSDSEDDGVVAEDRWDPAQGPVHSTPKGERACWPQSGPQPWSPAPGTGLGGRKDSPLLPVRRAQVRSQGSLWDPRGQDSTKLTPRLQGARGSRVWGAGGA